MRELATLLRRDPPEPLNEPLVRVIALVGEPDAGAQPQTARVLACNDGADDWNPFTLSDVRQERFEQVPAKRHWPVVIERVDLWMNVSTSFSNQAPVLHRIPASRPRSSGPRYRAAGVGSSTAQRGPAIGILRGRRIVAAAPIAAASAIGASVLGNGRSYG